MADWFVCVMGVATVFAGLISLVFICYITGAACKFFAKNSNASSQAPKAPVHTSLASNDKIANKGEIIAAACAAIAEELGEDVKNIKVVSFKKA